MPRYKPKLSNKVWRYIPDRLKKKTILAFARKLDRHSSMGTPG